MCVGVTVCGSAGVVWYPYAGWSSALLFHYLLLNMFRMLVHPSSGACDLLWICIMCCIALVRCVLVLQCGSAGGLFLGVLLQKNSVKWTHLHNASHGEFNELCSRPLSKLISSYLKLQNKWNECNKGTFTNRKQLNVIQTIKHLMK